MKAGLKRIMEIAEETADKGEILIRDDIIQITQEEFDALIDGTEKWPGRVVGKKWKCRARNSEFWFMGEYLSGEKRCRVYPVKWTPIRVIKNKGQGEKS